MSVLPPRAVTVYTATLGAVAAVLALMGADAPNHRAAPWWVLAALVAVMAASARLLIRVGYRDQVMALDLFEAALVPAIVLFPIPGAILAAMLGQAGAEMLSRNRPFKAVFNVAQWGVAAGAGGFTYAALVRGSRFDEASAVAVVVALVAVAAANMFAFAFVLMLAQRRRFWGIVYDLVPGVALGWMVNTAFGVLLVAAMLWSPLALVLFVVPLVMLHRAYRGYAAAHADRVRLRGMHAATRALNAPMRPDDAIGNFLGEVRRCFDARAAMLILGAHAARTIHSATEAGYGVRSEQGHATLAASLLGRSAPARLIAGAGDALAMEGWRDCVVAPLVSDGHELGALCVMDRSGPEAFEEAELSILRALASEAANSLRKGALFAEIVEERAKLAQIVGHTSDGICTIDATGQILTWNPGFEAITGFPGSERSGILDRLAPRDLAGEPVRLAEWLSWLDDPTDLQIVTRAGQTRTLSCSYTRVTDPDGKPAVLIVIARDVTAQREVERLKEDFIATVSHELRTPLTPILGWARMLQRSDGRLRDADKAIAVSSILRQAEHLQALISDLLDVTMIERKLDARPMVPLDAGRIAEAVAGAFRSGHPQRPIAVRRADEPWARGDEAWIRQVLSNLVSNALKYSPEPEPVEVVVRGDGESVVFDVIDRGPGIPAGEDERIFDRFHRLGDHMTREQGGTGLGLYIARSLAIAMGGTLRVTSQPGHGATFTLSLPAHADVAAVAL